MDSAIIILGGSQSSTLLIKEVSKEYSVIVVDKNPKAPGFEFADEIIIESTYNSDGIIEKLEALKKNFNFIGILTRSSGIPCITVAKIASKYNLPGIAPETAELIVYKNNLLHFLYPNETRIYSKIDEVEFQNMSYPVIMKPGFSVVGKKGIFKIKNEEMLRKRFMDTKRISYNDQVILQHFYEGEDIIVIGFSVKGEFKIFTIIDEINEFEQKYQLKASKLRIPSKFIHLKSKIKTFCQNLIDDLKIQTSIFFISLRVIREEFKIIEIHLDLGGDRILDDLLPASTDVNLVEIAIEVMTKENYKNKVYEFIKKEMTFFKNGRVELI